MMAKSFPHLLLLLVAALAGPAWGQVERRVPTINEPRPGIDESLLELRFVVQTWHSQPIVSLDVSPDGQFAVSAGDATPRIWKLATGEVVRELAGHQLPVTDARFIDDGKFVVTAGHDSYIRIWDWRRGRLVGSLGPHFREEELHLANPPKIAISADGGLLASTNLVVEGEGFRAKVNHVINIWDIESQKRIGQIGPSALAPFTMSENGDLIFAADGFNTIACWNTKTGKSVANFHGHSMRLRSMALSPDGKTLATASDDRTARLWDAASGRELRLLAGHFESVTDVKFTADGKRVITCGADSTIRVWDAVSGKPIRRRLTPTVDALNACALSPDGQWVVTAGESRRLHVVPLDESKPARELTGFTRTLAAAAISAEPPTLVTHSPGGLGIWDLQSGQQISRVALNAPRVTISRKGRFAASISDQGEVRLFDLGLRGAAQTIAHDAGERITIQFVAGGNQLLLISREGFLQRWDCTTAEKIHQCPCKALRSDSTRIAASNDGKYLATFSGHDAEIWDARTGQLIKQLENKSWIRHLAFSPDASCFLVHGKHECTIWNTERLNLRASWKSDNTRTGSPVISPGNQWVAVPHGEDVVLKRLESGKPAQTLRGHDDQLTSLAFSTAGDRLVTTSGDQTCRIWDVETGEELALLCELDTGGWVVLDPAGRFDGSDGGEIAGFHWVVGDEVISLHQLKGRYYEPRLLAKAMGLNKEPRREVAAFSTPRLFPAVDLTPPTDDTPLEIQLRNRGGGIGRVVVKLNGKELAADARGGQIDPAAQTADLVIDLKGDPRIKPGEENEVEVVVYNEQGYIASRDRRVRFRAPRRQQQPAPQLWSIVAGVSDYRGDGIDLRFAAKDAVDFSAALAVASPQLFGVDHVHSTTLSTDSKETAELPTRKNILAALQAAQASRPGDVVLIYLAGHGVVHGGDEGEFFFLTADAEDAELTDPEIRVATTVSSAELAEAMRDIPALKQILILDTCASGRFVERLTEHRSVPSSQLRALERLKDRTGTHVLAGCAADAVSYEANRFSQGLLTHSLLLGMRGAALRDDEFVDVSTLFQFAANRVPELAQDIGGVQRPSVASPKGGASFDFGRVAGDTRDQIPLQAPLPLMLRANFQDEFEFADTLSLSKLVNEQLRDVSSRGGNAPLVFVDAAQLPDAYRLVGRYEVDEGKVSVRARLFKGRKSIAELRALGSTKMLDSVASHMIDQLRQHLRSAHD